MNGLLFGHWRLWAATDTWIDRAILWAPRLIAALLVLVVGILLTKAARSMAVDALHRATGDPRAGNAWGTIVQYALLLLVVVASLAVAGVDLGAMMLAVGVMGFALAFAMQDTIANFIAGLILLSTHPFARGDAVELAGAEGTVERIGMRATQLRTFDGLRVEVPNRSAIGSNITVFSHYPTRRWDVLVGVSYEDDLPGAIDTVLGALEAIEGVLGDPEPEVFVDELGGSSVNLKVRFWTEKLPRRSMLAIKSQATRRVKEALDEAGYDIPFPIRTIFMHQANGASDEGEPAAGPEAGGLPGAR